MVNRRVGSLEVDVDHREPNIIVQYPDLMVLVHGVGRVRPQEAGAIPTNYSFTETGVTCIDRVVFRV